MIDRPLKTVTRTQGNNRALKEGVVKPKGVTLEFVEVEPLIAGFRRMVRGLEFDVSEMAITTHITAISHGKQFTALPIPLVRLFHHGAILVNTKAGITSPKDLEGKRVGVNRGYTVTSGIWARSVLADEYGVDLSKITWVLSGDEHVQEYRPPANVVPIEAGKDMEAMLVAGELVAAIGVTTKHPDVAPLIPNPFEAGIAAFAKRGHYPINHLVAVRNDVLAADPGVARAIFDAFAESKRLYVEKLKAGAIAKPDEADLTQKAIMDITGEDPLPYGMEPNRKTIETLIGHAVAQGIISKPIALEDLFPKSLHGVVG